MTGPADLDVCRFDAHCRTRAAEQPGDADGRGVCPACEAHARHAIGQLPRLYARVRALVGKDASVQGVGGAGGGGSVKVDPPTPLNLGMDALAREIAWTLDVWTMPVWERAVGSRNPDWSTPTSWPPDRAAALLVAHFPVLRSLPPTSYLPYSDNPAGGPAEDDGPAAVVALTDLYHRAKQVVGDDRRVERRDLPCPRPYRDPVTGLVHGCGQSTLVRELGAAEVTCTCCGWWCTEAEYTAYALTWQPPRLWPCPGCRAPVGQPHTGRCGVAHCTLTGLSRVGCTDDHRAHPALEHSLDGGGRCAAAGCYLCLMPAWTGVYPGVTEARQYGITLTELHDIGVWDLDMQRWQLPEEEPDGP